MSQRIISFSHLVNGTLADASSAVFRDPTAAYGLRRTDTSEILLAAGTAFEHLGTGLYSYTLTDPEADLTYQYWIEIVYGGQTKRFERLSYPPTTSAATSYLTVSEADAIAATMLGLPSYTAASTADRTKALTAATQRIDTLRFQGRKFDPAQTLAFPRLAYGGSWVGGRESVLTYPPPTTPDQLASAATVWDWDAAAEAAIVPLAVKRACLLEADSLLDGTRAKLQDKRHDGVASESVGSISKSYASTGPAAKLCRAATELLDQYRLVSGAMA